MDGKWHDEECKMKNNLTLSWFQQAVGRVLTDMFSLVEFKTPMDTNAMLPTNLRQISKLILWVTLQCQTAFSTEIEILLQIHFSGTENSVLIYLSLLPATPIHVAAVFALLFSSRAVSISLWPLIHVMTAVQNCMSSIYAVNAIAVLL